MAAIMSAPLLAKAPMAPEKADLQSLLRGVHEDYVDAFVASEGFGKTRLTPMMRLLGRQDPVGDTGLTVRDVQLIGIAKHDPPVVYESAFQGFQHGEDGPQFFDSRARAVDAEEIHALLALSQGQELVTRPEAGGLRMIGPIRARSECLQCHRGKQVGDLLGAFSYRLEQLASQGN
jgi:hypothetical protein